MPTTRKESRTPMETSAAPLLPLTTPEGASPWLSERRLNQFVLAFGILRSDADYSKGIENADGNFCRTSIALDHTGRRQPLAQRTPPESIRSGLRHPQI